VPGHGLGWDKCVLSASGRERRDGRYLELSTGSGGQQGCWASGDAAEFRLQRLAFYCAPLSLLLRPRAEAPVTVVSKALQGLSVFPEGVGACSPPPIEPECRSGVKLAYGNVSRHHLIPVI
jgi:hypothetical protein